MSPRAPRGNASPARLALETAAVFLAVALYLAPFRLYGFDVVDEGVQLVQIERVLRGEGAYRDFETSYTPAYFAIYAALWRWSGVDLAAIRAAQVGLHAAVVAGGFALARLWAGGAVALGVVLLQVAFLFPVSLRFGAPFNTPYPAWLATALALAAQAAVAILVGRRAAAGTERASARTAETALAVAAGAAAGLAFSIKPNAGVLALGGVVLAASASWTGAARAARALAAAVALGAALGAIALLWTGLDLWVLLALALPPALAALRVRGKAGDDAPGAPRSPASRAVADLAAIAAGFLAVVLPWLAPLAADLGAWRTLSAILHLEGSVVSAYLIPLAPPLLSTVLLVGGVAAAAWASRPSGARSARHAVTALALGVVLAAVTAALAREAPGDARLAAESACLWLGPALLALGLATCDRSASPASARERALLGFAAIYQLQLYPRPDLVHVAMGAPPVLLAVAVAWSRRAGQWREALGRACGAIGEAQAARVARRASAGVLAAIALLAAARALPALVERVRDPVVALDLGPGGTSVARGLHLPPSPPPPPPVVPFPPPRRRLRLARGGGARGAREQRDGGRRLRLPRSRRGRLPRRTPPALHVSVLRARPSEPRGGAADRGGARRSPPRGRRGG